MRIGTLLVALFVASCVFAEVTCITNQEFLDLVKDHVEDLESFDRDDPAIDAADDDDSSVVELPGNANDDLDVDHLLKKLVLTDVMKNNQKSLLKKRYKDVGWWHAIIGPIFRIFRRRSKLRRRVNNPLTHTFKINMGNKTWRFRVNGYDAKKLLNNLDTLVENNETGYPFVQSRELDEPEEIVQEVQ